MCIEDVRLQRETGKGEFVVNVDVTSVDFLPANPKRTSLMISSPIANRITLSFKQTAIDQEGIVLFAGNNPITLSLLTHGNLITGKISAIADTALQKIGIWESELNAD